MDALKNGMQKKIRIIVCILAIIALWCIVKCFILKKDTAKFAPPPPVVGISIAKLDDVPVTIESPAKIYGSVETEVRAQVSGILKSRTFTEGEYVEEGTILFTIDKERYQSDYNRAKGAMSQAESELKRATRDYTRIKKLFENGAVSQKQYDDTLSAYEKAGANLKVAAASLESAKINLDYTDVKAPISGIVRKEEMSVGNLVQVSKLLTSMVQVKPIHVNFSISGSMWQAISKGYKSGEISLLSKSDYKVALILQDDTKVDEDGKIIFVDSSEDPMTGCIMVKAEFPNKNRNIMPGQFARVKVIGITYKNVLSIPSSAVITMPTGNAVYILKENNIVAVQPVKLKLVDDKAVVLQGLKEGDKVISEGIVKARPGAPVTPIDKDQK